MNIFEVVIGGFIWIGLPYVSIGCLVNGHHSAGGVLILVTGFLWFLIIRSIVNERRLLKQKGIGEKFTMLNVVAGHLGKMTDGQYLLYIQETDIGVVMSGRDLDRVQVVNSINDAIESINNISEDENIIYVIDRKGILVHRKN